MRIAFLLTIVWLFVSLSDFTRAAASDFDLVEVPAGRVQLGDAQGDDNEVVRKFDIVAFRIMRLEVTNAQFRRFVAESGYRTTVEQKGAGFVWWSRWDLLTGADWRRPQGPGSTIADKAEHPVVQISAQDGDAFCRHYGLRLPSDEEWEYAARGTDGRRFPWGNNAPVSSGEKLANAGTIDCCGPDDGDGFDRTAPVGSFPAGRSPFGLLDMAGNVWEWTASSFPGRPDERALRGGGWGNNPYCLRTAYRHGNPPTIGLDMVGFRCAADSG
ncbi:formylglycine-generating enzyme family protein [Pelagibius sp. Alg239-R121]|uniref:formylglycine-generating enzyme family protein n=1 Tax=Pelagibius sp. Alg239-R121 TaxID=2993448 RepID=UPI0024A64468|nr:formylglycine-generating enzyme family protein [Pelagibius sp. Alg239-R121]